MWLIWLALGFTWIVVAFVIWMQFQVMRQSGAILSRLESLEKAPAPSPSPSRIEPELYAYEQPKPEQVHAAAESYAPTPEYGLPLGAAAPDFDLPDLSGKRHTLAEFRGKPVLIVFFSPKCGFCTEIAPDLARMPVDGAGGGPVPLILTNGSIAENREWIDESGVGCTILLQKGMEVANQYDATGTPMGYLIDAEGRIASKMAIGGSNIVDLIPIPPGMKTKPLSESKIARDGLKAGTPAPEFDLPNIQNGGGRVALSDYRGKKLLLVFSDPQCGPCEELAPHLEKLHRNGFEAEVVMVTRGDRNANRAKVKEHGLTFPVALQKQWEISKKYAMFATPIAYLVDETGVITRDVAIGVDDILALAESQSHASAGV
jgi:peroxiredoxin